MKKKAAPRPLRSLQELKFVVDSGRLQLSPNKASAERRESIQRPRLRMESVGAKEKHLQTNAAAENDLFKAAMIDVIPIASNKNYAKKPPKATDKISEDAFNASIVRQLTDLVDSGKGFMVSQTPEYMEGTGYVASSWVTEQLHQGEFSIQDHVDLHGYTVSEAKEIFDDFMQRALATGKRALLIIHGRGLSSPAEPVLKKNVADWLLSARWRKWLIAFTSAQMKDGGAGGTYVLLRMRPLKKRKDGKVS